MKPDGDRRLFECSTTGLGYGSPNALKDAKNALGEQPDRSFCPATRARFAMKFIGKLDADRWGDRLLYVHHQLSPGANGARRNHLQGRDPPCDEAGDPAGTVRREHDRSSSALRPAGRGLDVSRSADPRVSSAIRYCFHIVIIVRVGRGRGDA